MTNSQETTGYFRSGLPYNRLGHGPRILVVFQGLLFENKPLTGLSARLAESRAPTLVAAGAQEPCYAETLLRETPARIPNARR